PKCHEVVIRSPRGVWLKITDSRGKTVEVLGDAMVKVSGDTRVTAFGYAIVEVSGNVTVRAFENATVWACDRSIVRAWDHATVRAWDNVTINARDHVTVRAWDHATVRACDCVSVTAYDDATVMACGRAYVDAYGSATVKAGTCVPVYVHSKNVTHQGGVIIDMTAIDANDPETWCAMNLVEVDEDGQAHLYKALDADLNAGHDYRLTNYPIGHIVDDTANWVDNNKCGGGLHVSPTPWLANAYYMEASRFVEVCCPVEELRPIDEAKAKAPRLRVLREVTVDGSPVGGGTR
ncbi:DUF7666 domain-containing protein, partial [Schaalia turicensis]|uniref:DUF7666 domain-containing protein n=1 Tax=Schaalia turicensis TaxID=131111 RepID=UPI001E3E2653